MDNPIKEYKPWWKIFGTRKPRTATEAWELEHDVFERNIIPLPMEQSIRSFGEASAIIGSTTSEFTHSMNEIRELIAMKKI